MPNTDKPIENTVFEQSQPADNEINIWFDSYEELFSDFDPRSYSKRTLSNDFIDQIKKVAKDLDNKNLTLKLLMLESNRNSTDEKIIIERLHFFFRNNYEQLFKERKKANIKGITLTIAGVLSMIVSSSISFLKSDIYILHLLQILFDPAGWFLLWTGLDFLIYNNRKTKNELDFYFKLTNAEIVFGAYK